MDPQQISLLIYNIALFPVVVYSVIFFFLAFLNLFVDREEKVKKNEDYFPMVTVEVPSFNDPIAARCIESCMKFDYPKNRYEILILDDSTDEKTQNILKKYADGKFIKYIHRTNRSGYKPGALKEAFHKSKGEIFVVFDADFVPKRDFLKRIVQPFEDPKVGIVQSRQGFLNSKTNLISRFAAYMLMIYHVILMPINNKFNTVFFCGTAGAIRRKALEDAGGWNDKSITEDTDLSVKILSKKYKNVYLTMETPSEVPTTLESFLKQQMRWTYGNIRVFIDNSSSILFGKNFNMRQRIMITFMTLATMLSPMVILMTIAGFMGWFTGEVRLFQWSEMFGFISKILYTSGFLLIAYVAMIKKRNVKEFPKLLLATFSISIILSVANTVAIYKAIFMKNKPLYAAKNSWVCTPKDGNKKVAKT